MMTNLAEDTDESTWTGAVLIADYYDKAGALYKLVWDKRLKTGSGSRIAFLPHWKISKLYSTKRTLGAAVSVADYKEYR